MEFKNLAGALGVNSYPEKFEELYKNLKDEKTSFCDISIIEKYDKEFSVLGEHLKLVIKGAKEVLNNKELYLYGRTICEYTKVSTTFEARHVPLPELDGTVGRDVFGVLLIFSLMPQSVAYHREHGFTDEDIKHSFSDIKKNMNEHKEKHGRPALLMPFYNWNLIYVFGEMFYHNGFEYQFRAFYGGAMVLKNKKSNDYKIMMVENTFHKSGRVLGSAGAEDEEGSFDADFVETDEAFIGHVVTCGRVSQKITELKKEEWECVLMPGDEVMAVHIPRGTDLSQEFFTKSFEESFEIAEKRFPERNPKFLVCFSWLMDPAISALCEGSKLAGFSDAFLRYPLQSNGREFRYWVYPDSNTEDLELPQDTSLMRKLKALVLAGGHIYYTGGVCTKVLRKNEN